MILLSRDDGEEDDDDEEEDGNADDEDEDTAAAGRRAAELTELAGLKESLPASPLGVSPAPFCCMHTKEPD